MTDFQLDKNITMMLIITAEIVKVHLKQLLA
ncbi:uncharacterized protein METZ01_LOCUS478515 [marine metagenome]|uniref:Uncharacterized protein n=1 Tax=marine metagenome TaxID=408172 RepID=A0A383C0H2_9ZZZZ